MDKDIQNIKKDRMDRNKHEQVRKNKKEWTRMELEKKGQNAKIFFYYAVIVTNKCLAIR